MSLAGDTRNLFALAGLALILISWGGGGGGVPSSVPTPPPPTSWVQGQFAPESTLAAMCVTPRTGIDPGTQKAYPDVQGTLLDELNWLRPWNNDLYLWFDQVTDNNPATFATDAGYFDVLKPTQTTPSGKPEDRFHFTYQTSRCAQLSQSGVQAGKGGRRGVIEAP